MNMTTDLSVRDARKVFLKQQGLLRDNEFGKGKTALHKAIQRLGYVQIDTISVVNRAHEHVPSTRIENFDPAHLDRLTKERAIFEYWSHAAAFVPFEHYRYALPVMQGWQSTRQCDRKLAKQIVQRITEEGPLQSKDFEDTRENKRNGWWEWKPAKKVLDHLFLSGELMVAGREGFQKVYDLPERVIPDDIDTTMPTTDEWARHMVLSQVQALGLATELEVGYARSTIQRLAKINMKQAIRNAIDDLISEGVLQSTMIDGETYYTTTELLEHLPLRVTRNQVRILSPFDNSVINRKRTRNLFGFDYQLECYVPEPKRQFGYFSLPLLYGDELIGRMDAKAERKTGIFRINHLAFEPGLKLTDQLTTALRRGIVRFCEDHNCHTIKLLRCTPAEHKKHLSYLLEAPL